MAKAWEKKYRAAARKRFKAERKRTLDLLQETAGRKQALEWEELTDSVARFLEDEKENWRSEFIPLMRGTLESQGETLGAALGMAFDIFNPLVDEFLNNYTIRFVDEIAASSEEQIRAIIEQGQREGWSILQTQDALGGLFDTWLGQEISDELRDFIEPRMTFNRLENICRTETIRSSNAGNWCLYKQAGVPYLEWWTAADERTCLWCAELHGKVVGIDESYFERGATLVIGGRAMKFDYGSVEYPPLHCLCRCCLLPRWEPVEAVGPEGMELSESFDLSGLPGPRSRMGGAVRGTLGAINSVHGTGESMIYEFGKLPIKQTATKNALGAYRASGTLPLEINVSSRGTHPMMTTAHEIGHYIDHVSLGKPGEYASSLIGGHSDLDKWRDVVYKSDAVQELINCKGRTFTITQAGFEYTWVPSDNWIDYSTEGREIFARSYSQYIAVRSGDEKMLAELNALRNKSVPAYIPEQWDDEDFKPIAAALDELFKKKGWIR